MPPPQGTLLSGGFFVPLRSPPAHLAASLPNLPFRCVPLTLAPMTNRTLYIACYDISDARRLRKALHVLRDYATGGQKSVFECYLTDAEKQALVEEVREAIDEAEDRFLLLRLDPRTPVRVLGIAEPPADPDYFYVG